MKWDHHPHMVSTDWLQTKSARAVKKSRFFLWILGKTHLFIHFFSCAALMFLDLPVDVFRKTVKVWLQEWSFLPASQGEKKDTVPPAPMETWGQKRNVKVFFNIHVCVCACKGAYCIGMTFPLTWLDPACTPEVLHLGATFLFLLRSVKLENRWFWSQCKSAHP